MTVIIVTISELKFPPTPQVEPLVEVVLIDSTTRLPYETIPIVIPGSNTGGNRKKLQKYLVGRTFPVTAVPNFNFSTLNTVHNLSLTPYAALKCLSSNIAAQRPIKYAKIERHLKKIKEGSWGDSSQAIVFARGGKMMDGQHRCLSCVSAEKAISVTVTVGEDPSNLKNYDDGSTARDETDIAIMDGQILAQEVANLHNKSSFRGAAKMIWEEATDSKGFTVQEISKVWQVYGPSFTAINPYLVGEPWSYIIAESPILAALAIAHRKHPMQVLEMLRAMVTGDFPQGSTKTSPLRALNVFLTKYRGKDGRVTRRNKKNSDERGSNKAREVCYRVLSGMHQHIQGRATCYALDATSQARANFFPTRKSLLEIADTAQQEDQKTAAE